jgi:hypothetical protein
MNLPSPPEGAPFYKGEIADYWMEDRILISLSKSPRRTVQNIKSNIELVRKITGNKKVPLLIYLSKSPIPDKETREYVNRELPNVYKAMAMISDSALSTLIMNVLFKMKPPPIPMKNFSDAEKAKEWLKQFI